MGRIERAAQNWIHLKWISWTDLNKDLSVIVCSRQNCVGRIEANTLIKYVIVLSAIAIYALFDDVLSVFAIGIVSFDYVLRSSVRNFQEIISFFIGKECSQDDTNIYTYCRKGNMCFCLSHSFLWDHFQSTEDQKIEQNSCSAVLACSNTKFVEQIRKKIERRKKNNDFPIEWYNPAPPPLECFPN